nr:VWA domain-containing protein [Aquabacterium terrae]
MRYSLNVSEEDIKRNEGAAAVEGLFRQFGMKMPPGQSSADHLMREPTRMTVARRATHALVQRVPSDMSIGLVMVDECPAARPQGFFPPPRRGELLSRIQGIEPRKGTPLADGIAKAAQMVDGSKREALIVVVSDGTESCGNDPCAVAAQLRASKPRVKVNVVDITGTGAGNCVAQATGGKVFTARNADEVAAMTSRAAQEAMGPENCRKP